MRAAISLAAMLVLAACDGQPDVAAQQAAASPAPLSSPGVVPASASSAACAAGETPIFACSFADGKRVAVCGTAPGKAEYRFGGGDGPELTLSGGQRASVMYSGGGEQQLAFDNGDTRYIVFSRMVRTGFGEEGNNPAISDGVVVERAGTFAAIRICEGPDLLPVDTNAADAYLTPAQDLFTEETIRADPAGDE